MKAVAVLALLALVAMTGVAAIESTEVADVDFDELEAENDSFLQIEDAEAEAEEAEDESEEEDESEAEEEEESEDESEAESEEEGESLAETESEVDAEAVAEFEAAIGESAEGKWQVYSNVVTETAHEGICAAALASLPAATQKYFDLAKLKHGVIWNDMPSGTPAEEEKMIKDGHMDVDTWTRLFKLTGGIDDLVFNVHYGCLQHWHSMAPIQRLEAKNPAAGRIVFKNDQVKSFITQQLTQWWNTAVSAKTDKIKSSWYLGHVLHAIQDSYPRGHAVRTATPASCGKIVSFQGYDAQHGNGKHATADYSPHHRKKESNPTLAKRYSCAKDKSADVLRLFAKCAGGEAASCASAALAPILSQVYTLEAGAGAKLAGGSALEFAKAGIATDANYVKETMNGVVMYNPKSTKIWGTAPTKSAGSLCKGSKPIITKSPTGFGVYREKPFTGFVDPRP